MHGFVLTGMPITLGKAFVGYTTQNLFIIAKKFAFCDGESGVGGGNAGVYGNLHERFGDLRGRSAGIACCTQVQCQFVGAAERRQNGNCQQATGSVVESRPCPHAAPGRFGNEALEIGVETGLVGERMVDMLVAQHLPPDGHAIVVLCHVEFLSFTVSLYSALW